MKIAIVTETFLPSTDGVVTRLCATIKWLKEQGHDIIVIAPDLGVDEFEGVPVKGIPARKFFFYRSREFSLPSRKVKKIFKEFQPDVVHAVNPALVGFAGVQYAEKLKLPLVASYHTNVPRYLDYYRLSAFKPLLWWWIRRMHNKADLNLCTSQSVQKDLTGRGFHNVHVWKRGVAVDKFGSEYYDETMRERLTGGKKDKVLLLYVGRLAAEKEIQKIKDVLEESDQFCLALVGDGPYRNELERHFAGTDTVFTGFLHGGELAAAYASADAFIFPSTTETLGLVILEAMASGLPVIAADSGPTREQIEDEVTGLLYDPKDRTSFTTTVLKTQDSRLLASISAKALEEGRTMGWNRPAEQLEQLYKDVLHERAREEKNVHRFKAGEEPR